MEWRLRALRMTLASALLTTAMAGLFMVGGDGPLAERLEGQLLDLRFQLRHPTAPAADIALIAIDEKSLQRYGRWPLSRNFYAGLVDRLAAPKGGLRETLLLRLKGD